MSLSYKTIKYDSFLRLSFGGLCRASCACSQVNEWALFGDRLPSFIKVLLRTPNRESFSKLRLRTRPFLALSNS